MPSSQRSRSVIPLVALWTSALTVSCGGGSPSAPTGNGRISLTPSVLPLPVGGFGSLTATVTDASGAPMTGAAIVWTSRLPAVASVDNSGTVFAHAVGATSVVAKANGVADSVTVIVTDNLELEVQPSTATVLVSGTQVFTVIARNSSGQIVAPPPVTWTSAFPGIATITQAGIATGRAKGTTYVTATAGGVTSLPATLTVADAVCNPAITSAGSFEAVLVYDWVYRGTSDGGFVIDAEYHGD